MDDEADARFLEEVFAFWINPEIAARRAAGTLERDANLWAAQVIFNIGSPTVVRLNGEIRARALVKLRDGSPPAERHAEVDWRQVSEIQSFELTDRDPNAGHVTLVHINGGWAGSFDFIYNRRTIRQVMKRACEFVDAAAGASERGHWSAFLENLFTAAELTSKGWLYQLPDDRIGSSKKHGFILREINKHRYLGNVDEQFTRILNELHTSRNAARYGQEELAVVPARAAAMLEAVRAMISMVSSEAQEERLSRELASSGRSALQPCATSRLLK